MKSIISFCVLFILLISIHAEDASPLDMKLTPGQETMITCFVKKGKEVKSEGGKGTSEDASKADWTKAYHYKLYIPETYNQNKDKYYPCMIIASPGGKARMGKMANRLKKDNWVVVMLMESKNNTPDWLPNFVAAHDDVVERVRIFPDIKFATGLSGGARCASEYPRVRKGFRGLILQAAGFFGWDYENFPSETAVASTFGTKDFNLYESQKIRRNLNPRTPSFIEVFDGKHTWAPEDTFGRAVDWLEETTFIEGNKKASKKDKPAYVWMMDKKVKELQSADSDVDKYLLINKIFSIAKNGGLTADKKYAPELVKMKNQLLLLKKKKDVYSEIKAELAYKKLEKIMASFNKHMQKGKAVFKKCAMNKSDIKALDKMKSEMKKFAEKYPESHRTKEIQHQLTSIDFEYQKIDPTGK